VSNIEYRSGARHAPRTGKTFFSMQNSAAQGAAVGVARNDYFQIASSVMAAAAVAALCLGKGAQAAAPLAVQELDSVVVAASRSETRVEDMPLHTTVITQEEIRKSPAQSLDQLLRNVPGFNFSGIPAAQSDPTGQSTKMRGLGNAKVLMLLDGVPIHDPFYLTTQWFKVPMSTIERVEIVRGGNSSLWGNMAVGGVVNIVTRRVTDNSGEVSLSVGNQGTSNVSAVKNFKVSDALGFTLSLDRFDTNGYQQTPDAYLWRFPAKQSNSALNSNVQLTTYFQPSADLKGLLRLGYHEQDQNINYQYGRNLQRDPDFSASLNKTFEKNASLDVTAWAQNVSFEKYNGASCYWQPAGTRCPTSSTVTPANINNNIIQYWSQYGSQRYRERGGATVYSQPMSGRWGGFQLGADYRKLAATDLEYFYAAPTVLTNLQNFNSSTLGKGEQTFEGFFGQTKIVPYDALEITLSGRQDSWTNGNRSNTRTTAAGVLTGGAVPDLTKTAFNPSIAARLDLSDRLALRGAAYKSFRAPGFNNITRTYGTGTSTNIANPDLEPETLKGWEAGADFNSGPLQLGATYFLYNIEKMIATYTVQATSANIPAQVTTICGAVVASSFSNCSASSVKHYTNDQDGQSHGVELTGRWTVNSSLSVDASYTRTETYLTRRGSIVTDPLGVQIAGTPKDVATLGATWRPLEKLRTYAEARYVGPIPVDTTSVANTVFTQGGATIFNASASYVWDKTTDIFASAVNLLNKEYSENSYTYSQSYNRTLSMPRLINVGVKLRF